MIAEDNPTPPTTAPRLNFRTTGVGLVERTRCFTDAGEELAPNLNFPARDWTFRHCEFIAAAALPLVFVPATPDAIPAELLALPHDSKIVIRREISRYDVFAKAGVVMAEVAESIERHKQGLYTAREVAFMLEKQGGPRSNRGNLFSILADAAASGELVTVDPDECLPSKPGGLAFAAPVLGASINKYEIHWQYLRVADVNAWLESTGNPRRIQSPKETASAPAVAAPEPVAKPLQRQRHQEAEILRVLRELGHDPHALPRNTPGRAGPKAAAFGRLGWRKEERGVFDKAWERLRQTSEIADA